MSKWPDLSLKSRWGRVILAPPSQEDDAAVAAIRSDPVALKYVPFLPKSITPEQWKVKREAYTKKEEIWNFHVHLTPSSQCIGQCGIMDINLINRHAEIGIILSSHLHRTGIATESLFVLLSHAFEHPELKLHRVEFVTGWHNVQMRGWFKNFDVAAEYQLREAWSDGQGGWLDAVGYSILESEWPVLKMKLENWLDTRIASSPPIINA